jgi:DNA-directed RNA polymerase specialized sigma24 family protein
MCRTLLHLVDDSGKPASEEVRTAVHDAFTWTCRCFPRCDEVYLAEMAEALARKISGNDKEIRSVRSYAFAAMATRAEQWISDHPVERHFDTMRALERAAGASDTDEHARAEWGIFFQQMLSQLSERDRQILVLIEQGHGTPGYVATALNLSYHSAAKAIQRTRDRVAELGFGEKKKTHGRIGDIRAGRRWLPTHWMGVKPNLRGSG